MTQPAQPLPARAEPNGAEDRIVLHGVSWEGYEAILDLRGDRPGVRIFYLDGELELVATSERHERLKKLIARLLEAWADEQGIGFEGIGQFTMRSERTRRGAEPDECWAVGHTRPHPDLVIEVALRAGGIDKLEIYRGLGVREVWLWESGALHLFALRDEGYERIARSEVLPDLDLALLTSFLGEESQTRAVRAFRAALRGPSG